MENASAYETCIERLEWAIQKLNLQVNSHQLAEIAELIVQPMTGPWRFFHTPQHIFEVGGNTDPIEVLAALYHDLVYVQVDRSINFNVSFYISPFTKEANGHLMIRNQAELPQDDIFAMVMAVFGFTPGQQLIPTAGQNEFLSAVVAAKTLESILSPVELIQVIACIEATIPFRSVDAGELLYQRLQAANQDFSLGMTDGEIIATVHRGVRIANRDIGNFAHPSAAHFLANTWNLLPETNHNLAARDSYTVCDYRGALQKMEGFLNFLQPELIFRSFRSEPDRETCEQLVAKARRNLEIARLYLGSKLVSIAFVEAISFAIGLDVPITIMMGELPGRGYNFVQLVSFLPEIENQFPPQNEIEREVLNLLENGRAQRSDRDLDNSPLATLIVKTIGFDAVREQCDRAKAFFQGQLTTEDFVAHFPASVKEIVINAVLKLFESRSEAVRKYYCIHPDVLKVSWQS